MKDVCVTWDDRYSITKNGALHFILDSYRSNKIIEYYTHLEYSLLVLKCKALNDEHHAYMKKVANYCSDQATFIRALWD